MFNFYFKKYLDWDRRKVTITLLCVITFVCFKNAPVVNVETGFNMMTGVNVKTRFFSAFKVKSDTPSLSETLNHVKIEFRKNWENLMDYRVNITRIHNGCNTTWTKIGAIPWLKKNERTDTENSFINVWDINPAGEFSRVVLQTRFTDGSLKLRGGDSWRVFVRGTSAIPAYKSDFRNGSYEFKFLPMISGHYKLVISLEYTLCDGIKEPPTDWFKNGNVQGKDQKQGILFHDVPFVNKILWSGNDIEFFVPPSRLTDKDKEYLLEEACEVERNKCNYLWNGYGSWVNKTSWIPLCKDASNSKYPRRRKGTLWIFGDSIASKFYNKIKWNRICKKIFKNCRYSYNWIYSLENYNLTLNTFVRRNTTIEKKLWDNLDFNVTRILEELKQAVLNPLMDEESVILLNYGLHFTEDTNFTNFQVLIREVIKLRRKIRCKIIWRTTTSLNRHKFLTPNLHSRRFMTSQRVRLYNAYATNEFCINGFDVLDIYPLTDSYPEGTGSKHSPHDIVHYEYHVMKPMEELLERVFGQSLP